MSTVVSGLQHISNLLEGMDTTSKQAWLAKMGRSTPSTHTHERNEMATSNPHKEMPGTGVMYWEDEEMRKSPKGPDFKGFLVLAMDYKAGEKLKIAAWQKPTSRGNSLLSLKEDNWSKKKVEERRADKEVTPSYARRSYPSKDNDDSIPF